MGPDAIRGIDIGPHPGVGDHITDLVVLVADRPPISRALRSQQPVLFIIGKTLRAAAV